MSTAKKKEQWLTTGQAGKLLGRDGATIRRWVEKGFLDGYKVPGCQWGVSRASVDALLIRWKS